MIILEVHIVISVSIDKICACCSPGSRTNLLKRADVLVSWTSRDECRAFDSSVVKLPPVSNAFHLIAMSLYIHLINHQSLKAIRYRVYIVDPSKPRVHIDCRNSETGVNNQSQGNDSGWRHSLKTLLEGILGKLHYRDLPEIVFSTAMRPNDKTWTLPGCT